MQVVQAALLVDVQRVKQTPQYLHAGWRPKENDLEAVGVRAGGSVNDCRRAVWASVEPAELGR